MAETPMVCETHREWGSPCPYESPQCVKSRNVVIAEMIRRIKEKKK